MESIVGAGVNSLVCQSISWSTWQPLQNCWRGTLIPRDPGLYRIRRTDHALIDYIGQSGLGLRARLAMLKGIYSDVMPYNDPHTAGPALWAVRQQTGADFEVSVVTIHGEGTWRKGLEALAIANYRLETGVSPTFNFGRMPYGYSKSSGNNQRLVIAGKRFRGGPTLENLSHHLPGIGPMGPLAGCPNRGDWCGHTWSPWCAVANALLGRTSLGLYRLRGSTVGELLYIGQGTISSRLTSHRAKIKSPGHAQGVLFAGAESLEASWVIK